MSRTPEDDEALDLSTLAPREAFTRGLPAIGHEAARRARAELGERLGVTARWFLPIAAASAAACWFVGVRAGGVEGAQRSPTATVIGAGSDVELVHALTMPTSNGGGAR